MHRLPSDRGTLTVEKKPDRITYYDVSQRSLIGAMGFGDRQSCRSHSGRTTVSRPESASRRFDQQRDLGGSGDHPKLTPAQAMRRGFLRGTQESRGYLWK